MSETKKTYRMTTSCKNCGDVLTRRDKREDGAPYGPPVTTYFDVPIGVTVQSFLREKKCENCGCRGQLTLRIR